MSWTYGADPSNSNKDAVRLYVGDTDTSDQLLQDEEIEFLIATEGATRLAAARAAEAIAAKFSRDADEAVGAISVKFSQKAIAYQTLSKKLEETYDECAGIPIAGGISISDKDTQTSDSDRVKPSFHKDLHENPLNPENVNDENLDFFGDGQ